MRCDYDIEDDLGESEIAMGVAPVPGDTVVVCWGCECKEWRSLTLGWVRTQEDDWYCNPCAVRVGAEEGDL